MAEFLIDGDVFCSFSGIPVEAESRAEAEEFARSFPFSELLEYLDTQDVVVTTVVPQWAE